MENVRKTAGIGRDISLRKKDLYVRPEREYTFIEELVHALTHGIGALLGIAGLVFLLLRASGGDAVVIASATVYGVSLIILYSASFSYHLSCAIYGENTVSPVRDFFMKCDHSMIFILILGTYTPACLSAIGGWIGYTVFGIVASCSALGVILNVISVERFHKISLVLYLVTGWTIVVALVPYYRAIGQNGIAFLVLGGILYTVGVIFYKLKQIPYMHIIWHLFVLFGSVMHYIMVYFYCI